MKKLLFSFLFTIATVAAHAECQISWDSASPKVKTVMEKPLNFTFPNYSSICEKLNRSNAKVLIIGDSGVLNGRSFAWSNVNIADKKSFVSVSNFGESITKIDSDASTPMAENLLWETINSAIENMQIDKVVKELEDTRVMAKNYSRKQFVNQ